jgi:signal transduction histidine kinase
VFKRCFPRSRGSAAAAEDPDFDDSGLELPEKPLDFETFAYQLALTMAEEDPDFTALSRLLVSPRSPAEVFSTAERCLLEDLARQAGLAAYAVRLTADLQRSRERLVRSREEKRRRLRRELHNGLGPAMAGITMRIGALEHSWALKRSGRRRPS